MNGLLLAADVDHSSVLVHLDLCAAFNTTDLSILLDPHEHWLDLLKQTSFVLYIDTLVPSIIYTHFIFSFVMLIISSSSCPATCNIHIKSRSEIGTSKFCSKSMKNPTDICNNTNNSLGTEPLSTICHLAYFICPDEVNIFVF